MITAMASSRPPIGPDRGGSGTEAYAGLVDGLLSWWDGAELWLSGLGFVWQTVIVMPVALVLAYGIAVGVDALLGRGIKALRRLRGEGETSQ